MHRLAEQYTRASNPLSIQTYGEMKITRDYVTLYILNEIRTEYRMRAQLHMHRQRYIIPSPFFADLRAFPHK